MMNSKKEVCWYPDNGLIQMSKLKKKQWPTEKNRWHGLAYDLLMEKSLKKKPNLFSLQL